MCKAIVPVQRLQPGHDGFYNSPVQPFPGQHRWSQIANQNGRRFPKSITQDGQAFVRRCGPFRGGAGAIERGHGDPWVLDFKKLRQPQMAEPDGAFDCFDR